MAKYTKSDIVLSIAESIWDQETVSLIEKIGQVTGIDLNKLTEEHLQYMIDRDQFPEEILEFIDPHMLNAAKHGAGQLASTAGQHLGTAGGHIAAGAQHVASALGQAHPVALGAGALALGAGLALRARKNAKARAIAKAVGN